jgi:hypothetical protein
MAAPNNSTVAPQANSLAALASFVKDIGGLVNRTPRTPTRNRQPYTIPSSSPAESPIRPSPSQLTRFLIHAENKLGVRDASLYELPLRHKRYGPDILHRVPDSALEDLGIQPGDVIRLKDGAVAWWKGPEAKKKSDVFEGDAHPPSRAPFTVAYERRFADGGGSWFSGPPMVGGDPPQVPGETLWFRCEARKDWFPVPPGYTVLEEGDDDPFRF